MVGALLDLPSCRPASPGDGTDLRDEPLFSPIDRRSKALDHNFAGC